MASDHAASVNGVGLRATKLDPDGSPASGSSTSFVTSAFMSMSFTPEYVTGTEIQETAADGTICVYYQMPDVLKRVTMELAICGPDPELTEILVGGTILGTGTTVRNVTNKALTSNVATLTTSAAHGFIVGDVVKVENVDATFNGQYEVASVPTSTTFTYALTHADVTSAADTGTATKISSTLGYAAPELGIESTPNGIAVEMWSRAIVAGRMASVNPYWRWVFPFSKWQLSGDRTLENGMMANGFSGWGVGNANFGTGPQGDWPFVSDRAYQYARAASFPTGINGYQTVA